MSDKYLTWDEITKKEDRPEKDFFVKSWNGSVRIKAISGHDYIKALAISRNDKGIIDSDRLQACMVVLGLVEPELQLGDVDKLLSKNYGAYTELAVEIQKLSGMITDEEVKSDNPLSQQPEEG